MTKKINIQKIIYYKYLYGRKRVTGELNYYFCSWKQLEKSLLL